VTTSVVERLGQPTGASGMPVIGKPLLHAIELLLDSRMLLRYSSKIAGRARRACS